ncbi:uncharacterized protein FA14DRAFT_161852 [Meira miltonrushii]|uniref:Uncharacterized protein n=1 Tax=Meira miltonrushii TaxID=1280837 RepID=A0A316VG65_9BASI|nr:uncharacterized protein FA14DRAFT_161852 [Meira miltonrushii]PWN34475.1 hypothetical protein FA14DRAFT_161852 [Meira miltonrushii]
MLGGSEVDQVGQNSSFEDGYALAFTALLQAITGSRRSIGLERIPLWMTDQIHFIKEASILSDLLT